MSNKDIKQQIDSIAEMLKTLKEQIDEMDKCMNRRDALITLQRNIQEEKKKRLLRYSFILVTSWIAYIFTLYHLLLFIMTHQDIELPVPLVSFLRCLERCLYRETH